MKGGETMSLLEGLEKKFDIEYQINKRNVAEISYAIAVIARNNGDLQKAKKYAQVAISIFEELNVQTIEDAAARNNIIEGIVIPELIHENVVRERFKDILGGNDV